MGSNGTRAPKHLSAEGRRMWTGIVSEYDIDDAAGLRILRVAVESFDRCQEARAQIDKDGVTVRDRFGTLRAHPLVPVERDSRAAFLAGLKALNLDLEPLRDKAGRPPGG